MSTNVIKRTPAAGGPSYNPGDAFHVPPQGQYGKRDRDFHVGFDYAAPAGTQIPAASSGEVVYSGPSGGFHYAVMVKSTGPDGHDYYSVYGHVDPAGALPVGTKVSIGQPIGAVGTPHPDEGELSTGPHFHFQIATEEALHKKANISQVPGVGGLGFSTGQKEVFENPNEFKGWAWADKAPYNALTYVPIRDGVAYQPVPHLAQTQQAEQLFSAANSFNPPGVSPVEINRFYTETGSPSADPSGSLGNGVSRPVASPKMTVGISPAEIDRLYNFAKRDRSPTTPSTANGITPLNQTASVPWQSSPAVTSDYTPTDNFSWNNVPTGFGNRGPSPAGAPGGVPSPTIRAPQKDRRSAAPDGTAWTFAQGDAPTPSPSAFNASGPGLGSQIADALNAAGNRAVPVLTRVGKFMGDSLIAPAEGASPSGLLLRDPTASNLPGDDTQGIDSSKPERRLGRWVVNPSAGGSGDRPSSPAPQESQGPLSLNDAYLLYLAWLNANKPQISMSDPAPPTAPFDATNRNPPRLSAADWIASLAGVDPQNPTQFARSPQTRGLAGSSYSSNPVQPWLDAPIGGAPDNSAAAGNDNRHWYVPLGGLLWDGNKSPAPPAADASVPASPIVSTDDPNYQGGLLCRYLALAGLDSQNSNQPAPPPLDDEQDQANLQEFDARLSSTGDIRDAVALYMARKASGARGTFYQA